MSSLLDQASQKSFLLKLMAWYRKDGRHDMPWRKTKDPYAIFVSEYMLQQTTVSTVRPYYERFLRKFPTIPKLAKADLNDVLALWSGLGYYARARNLWAAMDAVQKKFGGKIPSDPQKLLKLPGIGSYTAGAITALAFNKPAAVLDANIIRVMMRIFALDDDPKLKAVQVILQKSLIDLTRLSMRGKKRFNKSTKGGPRDVVLALMDLGATLCAPKKPQCGSCPAATLCLARKFDRQEDIPPAKEKLDRPTVRLLHAVIQHSGKWFMGQRPKEGLFGGLWEFPNVESSPGVNPVLFLEEQVQEEVQFSVQVKEAIPAFDHQLSHKALIIRPYLCGLKKGLNRMPNPTKGDQYERFRWISPANMKRLGISSITKRIINDITLKKRPL